MKAKKLLAVVLALMLIVSLFAACGGSGNKDNSTPNSTPASTPADDGGDDASEPADNGDDAGEPSDTGTGTEVNEHGYPVSATEKGKVNQQTYPLVDEKITLDFWYPNGSSMGELADFNDGEFWQWYEELTNVHINFIVPAVGTEGESFQLLFASDDFPDMIFHSGTGSQGYRTGQDAAIEDGYIADMMEHLDWAPNYVSWLNYYYDDYGKAAKSDSGKMYGMFGVWDTMAENAVADQGIAIRKDFLDKVGMEVPTTYDEWETVLTAFKDELGVSAPFYTSKYGIDYGEFMAGYDTAPYWYVRDGKVSYGPMDDQYKEYLELLHSWWEKGLLDPDFATRQSTGVTADNDMMLNDQVGSLIDYGTRMANAYVTRGATNPDFFLVAAPQPVRSDKPVTPAFRNYGSGSDRMHGQIISFDAEGEHLETAIRWNDGFYAEDIFLNANFGLESEEGIVWYKAEDGHRIGDYDFRYSNPDGISSATVLVQFWTKNPPVRVESSQIEQMPANQSIAYTVWSENEPTMFLPNRVTMTADENTEYASYYSDIEAYVQEANAQFIMGQRSLDEYDAYRDTLKNMGIESCQELYQAAYDRYLAR